MKNILLIGDSILVGSNQTSGYGTIVRDMLKDKANVYIPLDNARYTMYTLRNLAGWIDPLLAAPNCIITPHISWAPKESRQRIMDCTIENVRYYTEDHPVNVINN